MNEDASVTRALGLLEELDEAREAEIELWVRAKELQIVALSNLRRPEDGRRLELELRTFLNARRGFDPWSAVALNRLRRSAEAIHAPQIAHDRLEQALAFFQPEAPDGLPAYPAEYLATLNNLCANELLLGRFEAARGRARRMAAFDLPFIELVLRRPELVWSNVLIAELLSGGPAAPIADAFARLTGGGDLKVVDEMLLEINLAAAQLAAGRPGPARERLAQSYGAFRGLGAAQPYVGYFAAANLAVLDWLAGDDSGVDHRLSEAAAALAEMGDAEYSPPFLVARMALLEPVLRSRPAGRRLEALGAALSGPPRVGESWAFFARPMLVTDIQFWSEI